MLITAIKQQIKALESILKNGAPIERILGDVWHKPDYSSEDVNYSLKWLREELARLQKEQGLKKVKINPAVI